MVSTNMALLTIIAFVLTLVFILWRPNELNEAIPAAVGAFLVVLSGSVSLMDLGTIGATISNAAITIMATIVMANVLESFGFFYWAAEGLAARANGSGFRLFWYVNLICFLMTLLFNNDGSILITTPILLILLGNLGLKNNQKIPYLLSGALIATASSAPIGVSNIVNLIALKIVDMSLYMHTVMMFPPATLGLLLLIALLFLSFYRTLPRKLPPLKVRWSQINTDPYLRHKHAVKHPMKPGKKKSGMEKASHEKLVPPSVTSTDTIVVDTSPTDTPATVSPPATQKPAAEDTAKKQPILSPTPKHPEILNRNSFMRNILIFVFSVRVSLFIASYFGIPISLVAVLGSLILLSWRWVIFKIPPSDLAEKTPWHIFVFAFSMYVIIYGLNNIGLTDLLVQVFEPMVSGSLLSASLWMGGLQSIMSIFFNNHPALLIGTLTLTNMNLDPLTLKIAYLASVIGSDVGSLLLPMGTLASLIWMHILRQHQIKVKWMEYVKVTIFTIPPAVIFTLVALAYWVQWIYG